MNQQKVFEYGKVKIKLYGGLDEIGGNCIVIEDKDRKIVFDNGIRFSIIRKFYGGRIEPLGPSELRTIGAIPPLEILQNVSTLYISHFHLDHTGLLSSISPEVCIKIPSISILEKTLASWYKRPGSWLAYVPPDYTNKIEEISLKKEDENNVIAIPVSHSCFPSYSFLYNGDEIKIFYSGDLRFEPLTNICSKLNEIVSSVGMDKVDVAIIEGTNFTTEYTPITTSMFRDYILLLLRKYEFVSISVDPLDLEAFVAILELSSIVDRNLVIGSERLLWTIEEIEKIKPEFLDKIYISEELEVPTPLLLKNIGLVNDVFKNPRNYVIIIEPIGLLQIIRKLKIWKERLNLVNSVVILMDPEPRESIKEVEEGVLKTWLKTFGIQTIRLRLSGHYLPHQFFDIIETLKPKNLIPIHTEESDLMNKLFKSNLKI